MSGPNDVDRLLHDWDEVASTAKPPAQDPRRSTRSTSALPVSMLLIAVVAVAVVGVVGRDLPVGPAPSSVASDAPAVASPTPEPSAGDSPSAPPLVADGTDEDDRFRLTLTTDRATYAEGDAIDAVATVTFLGPEPELAASHGNSPTPVTFTAMEPGQAPNLSGPRLEPMPCLGTTFPRDEPLTYPLTDSGATLERQPPNDHGLPVGTWIVTATLGITEGDCGGDVHHGLTADVVIEVVPAATPATPAPTPVDVALSDRGVADDGRFLVELETNGTTFQEGDTIRAGADVTFLGPEASVRTGHGSPAISFRVDEVGGLRSTGGGVDAMCVRTTFARDEAVSYPWQRSGSYSLDSPSPNDQFAKTYLDAWPGAQAGELRLPAGTWRLSAEFDVAEDDCGPHDPRTASVVIRVEPATSPPTPDPNEEPALHVGPVVVCDRVAAADCEQAVALVRETRPPAWSVAGDDAYDLASTVIVSDSCTPGAVCDRMYPFDAIVVLVSSSRPDIPLMPSYNVHGIDGFEKVAAGGNAFAHDWMRDLIYRAEQLVPIPTGLPRLADEMVCHLALLEGTLVEHADWGLAIGQPDRPVTGVIWPFGLSRDDANGPALVDGTGAVVAVVGDQVAVGGGFGAPGTFEACGPVDRTGGP